MRQFLKVFFSDDHGVVDFNVYLLMVCLLAFGMIAGLTTLRDQVVQNFGDTALALESLDQSYSFTVGTRTSQFHDAGTASLVDPVDSEPFGISVREPAAGEQ